MKTLRDLLDMPLPQLGSLLKNFLDAANHELSGQVADEAQTPVESVKVETETKPKVAEDLAIVLEYHQAIAEKYQVTQAESLLKHLASQLANERNLNMDDILDKNQGIKVSDALKEEVKEALEIEPEKRELLKMEKLDRAEAVANKTVNDNSDLVEKILNGDRDLLKDLDEKALKNSYGAVEEADLKFALRSVLQSKLMEKRV